MKRARFTLARNAAEAAGTATSANHVSRHTQTGNSGDSTFAEEGAVLRGFLLELWRTKQLSDVATCSLAHMITSAGGLMRHIAWCRGRGRHDVFVVWQGIIGRAGGSGGVLGGWVGVWGLGDWGGWGEVRGLGGWGGVGAGGTGAWWELREQVGLELPILPWNLGKQL